MRNLLSLFTNGEKKIFLFFFNQEKVKKSSVKKYLIDEYVNNHSKILFIIYDLKNNWIGHIGLSQINKKSATLDNLIRGEKGGGKNIIFLSEKTLINWALNKLNTQSIIGKLRSDNYIMYHIHSKIGFRISKKRHLFKTIKNNKIIHELSNIDQTNVDYQVVYIKYN